MNVHYLQSSRKCQRQSAGKLCKPKTEGTRQPHKCNNQGIGGPQKPESHWRASLRSDAFQLDKNFSMQRAPSEATDVQRRRASSSWAFMLKSARHEQSKLTENERRLRQTALQQESAAKAAQTKQQCKQRMDELAWRRQNALECRRHGKCLANSVQPVSHVHVNCDKKSVAAPAIDEVTKAVNSEMQAAKARWAKLQAMRSSCRGRDHLSQQVHHLSMKLLAWQALDPKVFDKVLTEEVFSRWLDDVREGEDPGEIFNGEAMLEEADDHLSEHEEEDFMAWLVGQQDNVLVGQQDTVLDKKRMSKETSNCCSPYMSGRRPPRSFAPPQRI
eukprot:gnl/MRDRNA2_/MRDRNA2_148846_c0_seq1.p1 gnl/MRDRNA2_/MRDRNA2_148846_c0~~gnl/MRDRNA2_/MRDRNA2_148846_c0_seq1.p1  ORF type:complete len:330 (+),score=58.88 gnl/MRDRNA2_/MRDRNA2_148846_c0_seq1:117-1106(+)